MAKLQFDLDRLGSMRDAISNNTTSLKMQNDSLKKKMETLKSQWNTPAGKKFFEEQDLDWNKSVDAYLAVMEDLKTMIDEAISQYEAVKAEADKISMPEI